MSLKQCKINTAKAAELKLCNLLLETVVVRYRGVNGINNYTKSTESVESLNNILEQIQSVCLILRL